MYWSDGRTTRIDPSVVDGDVLHVDDDDDNNGRAGSSSASSEGSSSFLVSMTRAAKTTGAYWYDDVGTKMCVHPRYGTWTSFLALVVFFEDTTTTTTPRRRNCYRRSPSPPPPCPCMVTDNEIANARSSFEYALGASSSSSSSDESDGTMIGYGDTVGKSWEEIRDYLRRRGIARNAGIASSCMDVPESIMSWMRLRGCYSSVADRDSGGRRYDAPQLLYHFTRDVMILAMELRRARDERRGKEEMK